MSCPMLCYFTYFGSFFESKPWPKPVGFLPPSFAKTGGLAAESVSARLCTLVNHDYEVLTSSLSALIVLTSSRILEVLEVLVFISLRHDFLSFSSIKLQAITPSSSSLGPCGSTALGDGPATVSQPPPGALASVGRPAALLKYHVLLEKRVEKDQPILNIDKFSTFKYPNQENTCKKYHW